MKFAVLLSAMLIVYATVLYVLLYRNVSTALDKIQEIQTSLETMTITSLLPEAAPTDENTEMQHKTTKVPKNDANTLQTISTNTTRVLPDDYTLQIRSIETDDVTKVGNALTRSTTANYLQECLQNLYVH